VSKVAIVAGGQGVLGRAVVAELHRQGYRVAVVDIALAAELPGAEFVLDGVDLADSAAVELAYSSVAARLGVIHAVVNVAGGFVWDPVEDGSLDHWDRMYRTNLRSAAASSRAAIAWLAAPGGAIVNVGAAGAERPGHGMAPYAASKAGVKALTLSLAEELRSRSVRVNAILPTIIDTPANRREMPDEETAGWVQPEAAAAVVAFLVSGAARAVTGAVIEVSLGG